MSNMKKPINVVEDGVEKRVEKGKQNVVEKNHTVEEPEKDAKKEKHVEEAEKNAVNVVKECAVNLVNVVKNVKKNVNVNALHAINTKEEQDEEELDKEVVQHKYFPVQTLNTILRGQLDH
jgi:hypothetical protein